MGDYTPEEFYSRVEWEGGISEAILEYGLTEDDLDDSDPELKAAVKEFRKAATGPEERLRKLLYGKYGE
ncbi:Uncharacterised protein [Mycobacteroides abscessus subsp. massiliense]|uniref:hypothetical protein n=1 Tax=Mycobacteroides abscessus TaxID=36809 RepID=UPI000927E7B1|nr:hypothetical protein [Mycobacteroides abscessus]SHX44341.1 Uncharacterised protein [Mycobacteroides abscessus subsp. abscessus]SKM66760.1 Uncharacterised protein [Mycobacteroides abscessus subsp. massiliense]SKN33339.1 Uncharacterised protein [Mycobacteroides abscessus subsp. massiliense]SKP15165.1 Uncharacterised protein [Mycobacteroides abscessus subsp. massiliense]SKP58709.1 Uncharacterised protein [Mycobacteroides abscessus subsp. massiliense]